MIYAKGSLKQKVEEIKAAHVKAVEVQRENEQKRWETKHAKWRETAQAHLVETLQEAVKRAKAGTLYDTYNLTRNCQLAPEPPKHDGDIACVPIIKELTALSELLDTLDDDTISASALARAGIKDMHRLLRRPC